ncbi:hypothetical protein V8G56_15540 [Gaetbulibacter aquiaggeris]|uniref:Lipoprotein n=1 Tax=Gaetbulibacter aquiaggeris TaxID=1735373 RepID=A0ABW7MTK4_9FLAO
MKTFKIYSKAIALFCTMLIFFQSCTVYKSKPISIESAVQNENKVKVKTKSGETFRFSRIGIEDDNYYGVSKNKGTVVKTALNEKSINSIKEKDKTLSTVLTIGLPIVYFVLLVSALVSGISGRGLSGK